jgi:hypothetical protein
MTYTNLFHKREDLGGDRERRERLEEILCYYRCKSKAEIFYYYRCYNLQLRICKLVIQAEGIGVGERVNECGGR